MFVFNSMLHIFLFTGLTVIVLLLLIFKKNPFLILFEFFKHLYTSKKYVLHFVAMLLILYFNKLELHLERHFELNGDFTAKIYELEGNFVFWVQHLFQNEILTAVLAYFYVIVFPAILITSIAIYTFTKNYTLFYALCYAVMLNYFIAIPFYLFFPVNEVWYFKPIGVQFLMLNVFPTFESTYRALSGLNNCFPSLHTSLSVTLALLAWRHQYKLWKLLAGLSAVIVIFSIFYLGIHWLSDMIGGVILGCFAAFSGVKLANRNYPFKWLFHKIKSKKIQRIIQN